MEANQIMIFIISSIVLVFTPGPDIFHVIARGIGQGKKAGFAAVIGCSLGNLVHTSLAVIGLSSIIASSQTAFYFLKIIGAFYLIFIGIKLIKQPFNPEIEMQAGNENFYKILRQAAVTNILNPKVGLFFLAFIPQFVPHGTQNPGLIFLVLGLLFVLITFIGFTFVTLGSGKLHSIITKKPKAGKIMHQVSGTMILLLGIKIAFDANNV